MKFRHVGNSYIYSRTTPLVKAPLNDLNLLDTRLEWHKDNSPLRVYVGASNVTDENYTYQSGLPQPGRFVYFGFGWSI